MEVKEPKTETAASDVTEQAAEEQAEPVAEEAEVGTRENPAPAGSQAKVGDYTVSLGTTLQSANDVVAAENEFNESPAAGRQSVMVPVTATYNGAETGTVWIDLSVKFVGSDGVTYGGDPDDYCGVIPGDLMSAGELYAGGTAAGNVCVSAPSTAVAGGVWAVEETFSWDDTKVFFGM